MLFVAALLFVSFLGLWVGSLAPLPVPGAPVPVTVLTDYVLVVDTYTDEQGYTVCYGPHLSPVVVD